MRVITAKEITEKLTEAFISACIDIPSDVMNSLNSAIEKEESALSKSVLEKIEQTQTETIKKCAKVIADSLVNGGAWHIQDSGHMLMHELITRSGGLAAIKPIQLNVSIKDEVREREGDKDAGFSVYKIPEFASLVVQSSKLRKGDVLVIGSTSGYSVFPVELALLAKRWVL